MLTRASSLWLRKAWKCSRTSRAPSFATLLPLTFRIHWPAQSPAATASEPGGQEHLRPEPGRGARVQLPLPTAASRACLLPAADQRADTEEAAGPMWYLRPPIFWSPACPHSDRLKPGGRERPKLPSGHRFRKSRARCSCPAQSIPVNSTTGPKQWVVSISRLTDRSLNGNKWPAASSLRCTGLEVLGPCRSQSQGPPTTSLPCVYNTTLHLSGPSCCHLGS